MTSAGTRPETTATSARHVSTSKKPHRGARNFENSRRCRIGSASTPSDNPGPAGAACGKRGEGVPSAREHFADSCLVEPRRPERAGIAAARDSGHVVDERQEAAPMQRLQDAEIEGGRPYAAPGERKRRDVGGPELDARLVGIDVVGDLHRVGRPANGATENAAVLRLDERPELPDLAAIGCRGRAGSGSRGARTPFDQPAACAAAEEHERGHGAEEQADELRHGPAAGPYHGAGVGTQRVGELGRQVTVLQAVACAAEHDERDYNRRDPPGCPRERGGEQRERGAQRDVRQDEAVVEPERGSCVVDEAPLVPFGQDRACIGLRRRELQALHAIGRGSRLQRLAGFSERTPGTHEPDRRCRHRRQQRNRQDPPPPPCSRTGSPNRRPCALEKAHEIRPLLTTAGTSPPGRPPATLSEPSTVHRTPRAPTRLRPRRTR